MSVKLPFIKKRFSLKAILHAVFWTVLVGGITAYIIWDVITDGPLTKLFSDRDRLISAVQDSGPLGPLLYIILQITQTILAPIPGNVVGGIGGFLFDWWGILWTTIGSCIGAWIVFSISRRFGRKFAEKIVKKPALDKMDFILKNKRASLVLFMIYLIPGLPDDIVCYVAGLTKIPVKKLVLLFGVGRLPSVIVTNYIGMGLGDGDWTMVGIVSIVAVLIFVIAYLKKDAIIARLKKTAPRRRRKAKKAGRKAKKTKRNKK